jgi:hypothetical protein
MPDQNNQNDLNRAIGESEIEADIRSTVFDEIEKERNRQIALCHGGDTEAFDKSNTQNDWIAYILAYAGRAAQKVFRNEKEGQTFEANITKVAALCVAALEARKKGYC